MDKKYNDQVCSRNWIRVLLVLFCIFFSISATASDEDNDNDGWPTGVDCNDNDPLWYDHCTLEAYQGCTNVNQFANQCLPNVSNVEKKLDSLHQNQTKMDWDKHTWKRDKGVYVRPGDNLPLYASKRHVQSIQYINNSRGNRYIITSLSDEHNNKAAIQLVKTVRFANNKSDADYIVAQYTNAWPLTSGSGSFNHPGGSQLIGQYLFLALEDFQNRGAPYTGVWKIDPEAEDIFFRGLIGHSHLPSNPNTGQDDNHQSTAAVTRLADESFLLATCVGPGGCDYINFYKSTTTSLESDLDFVFVDQWYRGDNPPLGLPDNGYNWDECGPQNMNFIAQDDGKLYLVFFGGVNRGVQKGTKDPVRGNDISGCSTGVGYDDHLFGYKVQRQLIDNNYEISLQFTNKVPAIDDRHTCKKALVAEATFFHGLNFLAGSGLWLRPDGRNTVAYLTTEHYDTCDANDRYLWKNGIWGEGVYAKTRWGVSRSWRLELPITVDHTTVSVDEGEMATNTGTFKKGDNITLWASIGVIEKGEGTWNWSWSTNDGPDDSQLVTITRKDGNAVESSTSFNLVVKNVAPKAEAGPDQLVECVDGMWVSLDASGSTDPGTDILSYAWTFAATPGTSVPTFDAPYSAATSFQPIDFGSYEAMVTVTDDDGGSDSDTVLIEYEDTTPPDILSVSVAPNVLWPPNHKMAAVKVSVSVFDACDTTPVSSITSIESNEPDNGDSEISGDLTANLRAERLGAGTGRIYNITAECTDAAGNSSVPETTTVTIPHSQGKSKNK